MYGTSLYDDRDEAINMTAAWVFTETNVFDCDNICALS